ncbi:MAG: hypothetical protein COA97_12555 [Flavobacteriales bacterium]|nr:MAG: hypothetical protein COA97_12555 [Flavobacteriales bacterium]
MGFTVSSHICGGKKVKTTLSISKADFSCSMEEVKSSYSSEKQMKKSCCKNEFQLIQIEEDYIQELTEVDFSAKFFISLVRVRFALFENTTTEKDFFNDYLPPPLIKDISILIQSFLI